MGLGLFLLGALLMAADGSHDRREEEEIWHMNRRRQIDEEFEEADSFFDRDGNEHIVDDEGYCEDCDDYHDDF